MSDVELGQLVRPDQDRDDLVAWALALSTAERRLLKPYFVLARRERQTRRDSSISRLHLALLGACVLDGGAFAAIARWLPLGHSERTEVAEVLIRRSPTWLPRFARMLLAEPGSGHGYHLARLLAEQGATDVDFDAYRAQLALHVTSRRAGVSVLAALQQRPALVDSEVPAMLRAHHSGRILQLADDLLAPGFRWVDAMPSLAGTHAAVADALRDALATATAPSDARWLVSALAACESTGIRVLDPASRAHLAQSAASPLVRRHLSSSQER